MGAQQRVFRRRIKSVQSTKKITRAMELIAASRIVKAQQRVAASTPYAEALTAVVQAVASNATTDHLLTTAREHPTKAAVLVVTSDRGLAGGYSSNALKTAESLVARLRDEGKEARLYVIGRKGVGYYRFRDRAMDGQWTGFSEQPDYSHAKEAADTIIEAFRLGAEGGGVDELHVVYTEFLNAVTQRPKAVRLLPLVVDRDPREARRRPLPLYEFEPSAEAVLDALLPRYVECADLERAAAVGSFGVRGPPPGDEVGDRQRGRADQELRPAGERCPSGRDHAGNHGDRRWRRGAVRHRLRLAEPCQPNDV